MVRYYLNSNQGLEQIFPMTNYTYEHFRIPIQELLLDWCLPLTLSRAGRTDPESSQEHSVNALPDFFLGSTYQLPWILTSQLWLEEAIAEFTPRFDESPHQATTEQALGRAFGKKYGNLKFQQDARAVVSNWRMELDRSISHLGPRTTRGKLLHVGADSDLEIDAFHASAKSVVLVDIASRLLQRAYQSSDKSKTRAILTSAESLANVGDSTIDMIVALRVYSSARFDINSAVASSARVLRNTGGILISIPNGYRAIDDTILPGQIDGTPPTLNFSLPFSKALEVLCALDRHGFRELFLVMGSAEIFVGGTYAKKNSGPVNNNPILHLDGLDHVPLCFYSDKTPTSWLGNYSNHPVEIDNVYYQTVEHYFQASKFGPSATREQIKNARTPDIAKEIAWKEHERVDKHWDSRRLDTMRHALQCKFSQHASLRQPLMATRHRTLVERSDSDRFWGQDVSENGQNNMGALLMELRQQIRGRIEI